MQDSLINQGVTLMLAGMGTVFVFLTVLVLAISLLSMLLRRGAAATPGIPDDELAAVAAAVREHRRR